MKKNPKKHQGQEAPSVLQGAPVMDEGLSAALQWEAEPR